MERRHSYLLGKHVYYWIFRIFLGDVIGKMQMAFGVVAYCSFILFVLSCGLQLLDLEQKVELDRNFFDKLQTSVKFGSKVPAKWFLVFSCSDYVCIKLFCWFKTHIKFSKIAQG